MRRQVHAVLMTVSALGASSASAQAFESPLAGEAKPAPDMTDRPSHTRSEASSSRAVGIDVFTSTDADHTDVLKIGVNFDWRHMNAEDYLGIRLEKALFKPRGQQKAGFERLYLRNAGKSGHWAWNGQIGTDGDTALGSISFYDDAKYRKEFFVERDIVETLQGVKRGIYYTFAGAAVDVPLGGRTNSSFVAGVQEFTGDNVRFHIRANYVYVVKPNWGFSVQLRNRYFHNSHPREYDYFSPRWYASILPVAQVRRYSGGWRYLAAAGLGAQRDSGTKWRTSRYLSGQLTSPLVNRNWLLKAQLIYTNTPVGSGQVYDYLQGSFGITRVF